MKSNFTKNIQTVLKTLIIIDFLTIINEKLNDFQSFKDYRCVGYCKNYETSLNSGKKLLHFQKNQ